MPVSHHQDQSLRNPSITVAQVAIVPVNQRTIGPENAHLKPDPGVLSHHEMTLTLNTQHTFIEFISCLHLQSFRSQAAIVSKPSDL